MSQENGQYLVYIGTYTRGASEGVYVYRFDASTGSMEHLSTAGGLQNPTFLAIDPAEQYLYAVEEIDTESGHPAGVVHAFSIDQTTGELTRLNHQPLGGTVSCHLSVDSTGRYVLFANYGSGSVGMLPIREDGSLNEMSDFVQHEGSSVDANRKKGPHAHSINVDPTNRYAFVPDLGLDKVFSYRLDLEGGRLVPNDPPSAGTAPGAGPRHFDFHPTGSYAYVINELDSTMIAFEYHTSAGVLKEINTVSTLPADFTGTNDCADVHVHPSGRFVYGSNRGHNSIAICEIDEATGALKFLGTESTQGETPRNFAIDPTGAYMLAANQDSDTVVIFRIDQKTGMLEPTGQTTQVPAPVCLKLIPTR